MCGDTPRPNHQPTHAVSHALVHAALQVRARLVAALVVRVPCGRSAPRVRQHRRLARPVVVQREAAAGCVWWEWEGESEIRTGGVPCRGERNTRAGAARPSPRLPRGACRYTPPSHAPGGSGGSDREEFIGRKSNVVVRSSVHRVLRTFIAPPAGPSSLPSPPSCPHHGTLPLLCAPRGCRRCSVRRRVPRSLQRASHSPRHGPPGHICGWVGE